MNLQDQVISFKVAKQFSTGSSLFFWVAEKNHVQTFGNEAFFVNYIDAFVSPEDTILDIQERYIIFPAFTTAELLDMLPPFIKIKGQEPYDCYSFSMKKRSAKNIQWIVNYECDVMQPHIDQIPRKLWVNNVFGEHLPDVLAETYMRISVIEKVVNQPLKEQNNGSRFNAQKTK